MINPELIKLASLPIQTAGNISHNPKVSGEAGDVFGPSFREYWHLAHKGLSLKTVKTPASHAAHKSQLSELSGSFRNEGKKTGTAYLLDQLREGLLAKGKPLSQISLKQEDLFLLKAFLRHLGFSERRGEDILKRLAENHPEGEIRLSQFFQHIEALGLPDTPSQHLEPSLVPHLESALRIMGLTPEALERAFSEAKHEQGGLDLTKLVAKLKALYHEMGEGSGMENRPVAFDQISAKLERIGLHPPVTEKQGQLTLQDFISSLERLIGERRKGDQRSADIQGTIHRILERVALSNDIQESPVSSTLQGKHKMDFSAVKETIVGSDGILDRAAPFKRKEPFAPQAGKGDKQAIHGPQKPGSLNPVKGLGLPSQAQGDHGSEQGLKGDIHQLQTDKMPIHVQNQTTGSFSEAVQAIKQNQMPTRDALPAYLLDQLGRQISKSIQRGDRVIKIQLKPPELGVVKVEMDLKENVLKLGMITENSSVRELLLANASDLREALVEQGVKLEKIDVQIGDHSNQNLGDLKEGLKEGKGRNQDQEAGSRLAHDPWADRDTGSVRPFKEDQILDLVA